VPESPLEPRRRPALRPAGRWFAPWTWFGAFSGPGTRV